MGQASSGGGFERRGMLGRLSKRGRDNRNLSHTHATITGPVELLDVNRCSEELLMTLPGFSRASARSLVRHRRVIGGFKRVDDLALVPGIGAEKLEKIRTEICVRKQMLDDLSRTQSSDSIVSTESSRTFVNVNTANVFQLQCIHGLNQELAANILYYREKKGPFKSLDDLIKVKGMNKIRLGSIKSQLSLDTVSKYSFESNAFSDKFEPSLCSTKEQMEYLMQKSTMSNGKLANGFKKNGTVPEIEQNGHCKPPVNGLSKNSINDIFELLSLLSRRPVVEEDFKNVRNNRTAIRIATWNLHQLNIDKANNPGFREVVCRTILENRLSIIGVQDILEQDALKIICDELNKPVLCRVNEFKNNGRRWKYCYVKGISSDLKNIGFIYESLNKNIHIHSQDNEVDADSSENLNFNYGCTDFIVNDSKISILNVQLTRVNVDYSKAMLCDKVDRILTMNKNLIIIGDFYSSEHVRDLATCYKSVIDPDSETVVEVDGKAVEADAGNIMLIGGDEAERYAFVSGVVRKGLCHLAIPHGWSWGGPSSPYCPIWAEFYVD